MKLTTEQIQDFFTRIEKLDQDSKPKFGKMNVNQMVCHCTDFFRMAIGTKRALEYGVVDPKEIIGLSRSGKTAPAPKGFGQVEGDGTSPTALENDKRILKEHIVQFVELDDDFEFSEHPYFGLMSNAMDRTSRLSSQSPLKTIWGLIQDQQRTRCINN